MPKRMMRAPVEGFKLSKKQKEMAKEFRKRKNIGKVVSKAITTKLIEAQTLSQVLQGVDAEMKDIVRNLPENVERLSGQDMEIQY